MRRLGDPRVWLVGVFGLLALFEGLSEPTEGLIAQPVRSLLSGWGQGAGEIAAFSGIMGAPWVLKPLLGLFCDVVPIGRSRRKAYLLIAGVMLGGVFGLLGAGGRDSGTLLIWLCVATTAAALADVATDALVVEWGQIHERTGRYQSAIWFGTWGSGVLAGKLGGVLTGAKWPGETFAIAALAGAGIVALTCFGVREPTVDRTWPEIQPLRALKEAARSRGVLAVAAFLALWNFNPLSNALVDLHMSQSLKLDARDFGDSLSVFSLAAMAASAGYGFYCRRVPMRTLAHASIVLGIVQSLLYVGLIGRNSALAVHAFVGFSWMTASLIQFDLAARVCPPGTAATVFASLMALSNLSTLLATASGGALYESAATRWGAHAALPMLAVVGAFTTGGCWLILPFFPASVFEPTVEGDAK
jgi:MFS family permease